MAGNTPADRFRKFQQNRKDRTQGAQERGLPKLNLNQVQPTGPAPAIPTPRVEGLKLGLFDPATRARVEETMNDMNGFIRFLGQAAPATAGAWAGAKTGALLMAPVPIPGARVAGALIGGMAGGFGAEAVAQDAGVVPRSDLGLALSGGAPGLGSFFGGVKKVIAMAMGGILTKNPVTKAVLGRDLISRSYDAFKNTAADILGQQKGMLRHSSDVLHTLAAKSGLRIPAFNTTNTRHMLETMRTQLKEAVPTKQSDSALRTLNGLINTVGGSSVTPKQILAIHGSMRKVITEAGNDVFQPGTLKKAFAALDGDIEFLANLSKRSKTGKVGRLIRGSIERLKLESAMNKFDHVINKKSNWDLVEGTDDVVLHIGKIRKDLRALQTPNSGSYDAAFSNAIRPYWKGLNKSLKEFEEFTVSNPAGPGGLVLRSATAGIGRQAGSVVGGAVGFGVGSVPGAAIGAVVGAQGPEMLVSILSSPRAIKFLKDAGSFGGTISMANWNAAFQLASKGLQEKVSQDEQPRWLKGSGINPYNKKKVGAETPGDTPGS